MSEKYQQFLGSTPGLVVELMSDDKSPFKVRTENGFEFWVSSEDFREYYREEKSPTPEKWKIFVTEPVSGQIETFVANEAVDMINLFKRAFQDFSQARLFLNGLFKTDGPGMNQESQGFVNCLKNLPNFPVICRTRN